MRYYFLCNELVDEYENSKDMNKSIKEYIENNYAILNEIYFKPKKIDKYQVETIIKDSQYKKILLDTITNLKDVDLDKLFPNIVNELGNILDYNAIDKSIYVIIGLNTTTIYKTKYQNKDITVILLESSLAKEENIRMLLAHEYTHWIRENAIKHDIFEICVGERLITEGIACAFSEEIVPNKSKSYYCIVPNETVKWVEDNIDIMNDMLKNQLNKKEMIYDLFYMFAKTKLIKMPVRTGYVYGYLKVKEYMKNKNLKVKDIVQIDWKEILS